MDVYILVVLLGCFLGQGVSTGCHKLILAGEVRLENKRCIHFNGAGYSYIKVTVTNGQLTFYGDNTNILPECFKLYPDADHHVPYENEDCLVIEPPDWENIKFTNDFTGGKSVVTVFAHMPAAKETTTLVTKTQTIITEKKSTSTKPITYVGNSKSESTAIMPTIITSVLIKNQTITGFNRELWVTDFAPDNGIYIGLTVLGVVLLIAAAVFLFLIYRRRTVRLERAKADIIARHQVRDNEYAEHENIKQEPADFLSTDVYEAVEDGNTEAQTVVNEIYNNPGVTTEPLAGELLYSLATDPKQTNT